MMLYTNDQTMTGKYLYPFSRLMLAPMFVIINAGRSNCTPRVEIAFALASDRKLYCAVKTPNPMVSRTDRLAWKAPRFDSQ